MVIYKVFRFDAAHFLPNVPKGHKCGNIHGHSYTVKIFISGKPDRETGWIIDYTDIKMAVQPFITQLDHHLLNNISGLENPTSENLSIWLWDKLNPILPGITRIELNETIDSGVIYEG